MKNRSHRYRTTLALAGLCAVLGYMVVKQLSTLPTIPNTGPGRPAGTVATAEVGLPPLSATPLDAYTETTARPLFQVDRRPPPVERMPTGSGPTVERLRYALVGVTIFDGERVALIQPDAGGRALRVTERQRLGPWRVAEIGTRHIVLLDGERSEVLRLVDRSGARSRKPTARLADQRDVEGTLDEPQRRNRDDDE